MIIKQIEGFGEKQDNMSQEMNLIEQQLRELKNTYIIKQREKVRMELYGRNRFLIFFILAWLMLLTTVVTFHHFEIIKINLNLERINYQIHDLYDRVTRVENVVNDLKEITYKLNNTVNSIQEQIDKHYKNQLDRSAWFQTIDSKILSIFSFFSTQHASRSYFGLGCFPGGTMIQVDSYGNTLPIEEIVRGSLVWNPDLEMQIPVKVSVAGEENGMLYKITLSDGLVVTVTETHPMKISKDGRFRNIAAKDCKVGDMSITVNSSQEIVNIEQTQANGIMVYNFQYDFEDIDITERTVIAGGVYTLDLFAQKQNELKD